MYFSHSVEVPGITGTFTPDILVRVTLFRVVGFYYLAFIKTVITKFGVSSILDATFFMYKRGAVFRMMPQ